MADLPDNVESSKDVKPKGLSWPLKASELVDGLGLAGLGEKVRLSFSNSGYQELASGKREMVPVFSVTHNGSHTLRYSFQAAPYFNLNVNLCLPKYRQKLAKAITEHVLQLAGEWMVRSKRLPSWNGLLCEYAAVRDAQHQDHAALVVSENRGHRLLVFPFDLEEQCQPQRRGGVTPSGS